MRLTGRQASLRLILFTPTIISSELWPSSQHSAERQTQPSTGLVSNNLASASLLACSHTGDKRQAREILLTVPSGSKLSTGYRKSVAMGQTTHLATTRVLVGLKRPGLITQASSTSAEDLCNFLGTTTMVNFPTFSLLARIIAKCTCLRIQTWFTKMVLWL